MTSLPLKCSPGFDIVAYVQPFSPISPRATITSSGVVLTPLIRILNQAVVDGRVQGLLYRACCAALRVPGPVLYPYIRFLHTYKHL